MFVADEGAHLGGGVRAGADFDFGGDLADAFDDLVVDALVNHEPRSGAAALALVEEDGAGGSGDGFVEIGVREDDCRALAAELESDFLEVSGGGLDDEAADLG